MGSEGGLRPLAFSAFLMLTVAMVSGELVAGRLVAASRRRRVFGIHRASAVAGLGLVALHVGDVVVPGYAGFDPWTVSWANSSWIVLGVAAAAGIVASLIAWLSRRAAARRWRTLHLAAYAGFGAAVVHAWFSHPAPPPPAEALLYVACLAAVVGVGIRRWLATLNRPVRAAL